MKYQMHVRQQHARQGKRGFWGPDTYVAVTIAPDNAVVPKYLNQSVLEKRGIEIRYFGAGYREHRGPKSQLGRTIASAQSFMAEVTK